MKVDGSRLLDCVGANRLADDNTLQAADKDSEDMDCFFASVATRDMAQSAGASDFFVELTPLSLCPLQAGTEAEEEANLPTSSILHSCGLEILLDFQVPTAVVSGLGASSEICSAQDSQLCTVASCCASTTCPRLDEPCISYYEKELCRSSRWGVVLGLLLA